MPPRKKKLTEPADTAPAEVTATPTGLPDPDIEFDPAKLLASAVIDKARKYRKRAPDEVARLTAERRRP